MPLGTYEVNLLVRATNQASGPLRAISRDLAGMSNAARSASAIGPSAVKSVNEWKRVGAVGSLMRDTGRSARLMGIGVAFGVGLAAKSYADFNTEITLAATQTTKSVEQIAKLGPKLENEVLAQMREFPATSQQMTKALYDIYSSLTLPGGWKQGTKLLKLFNKAAVAGQTDLTDVAHAGITVMNAFKIPMKDMNKTFQLLFAGVRFGRMTFSQLTQSMNQLVPAFSGAGLSIEDMVGSLAFLTRKMPSVQMAATALARLTEMFAREDFVKGLKKSGVEIVNSTGQLIPFEKIISKIAKEFPELAKGGQPLLNFFKTMTALGSGKAGTQGTIQGRRALQALILDSKGLHDIMGLTRNDLNEFTKSYNALRKSPGVRWKQFINDMHALSKEIGREAIPAILGITKPIQRLVKWFGNLDDATKRSIGKWLVYGAGIALVGGQLLTLVGGLLRVVAILGQFRMLGFVFVAALVAIGVISQKTGNDLDFLSRMADAAWNALKRFFDFAGSGWKQFGVAAGIGLFAVSRVMRSISTARAAGSGGMLKQGGLLGLLIGGPQALVMAGKAASSAKNMTLAYAGMSKALAQAGGAGKAGQGMALAKGAAAGLGLSLAAIPPLAIAGGIALVGLGLAAMVFHKRAKEAREDAKDIADMQQRLQATGQKPVDAAKSLRGLGGATVEVMKAKLDVADYRTELERLNKVIANTKPGTARNILMRQQQRTVIALAESEKHLGDANWASNVRFNQITKAIQGANTADKQRAVILFMRQQAMQQLAGIEKNGIDMLDGGVRQYNRLKATIRGYTAEIWNLKTKGSQTFVALRNSFSAVYRDFQRLKLVPKVDQKAIDAALEFAVTRKGRMLSIPELKVFMRAYLNPKDLKNIPADVRKYIKEVIIPARIKIKKVEAKEAAAAGKAFAELTGTIKPKADPKSFNQAIGSFVGQIEKKRDINVGVKIADATAAARRRATAVAKVFAAHPATQKVIVGPGALAAAGVLHSSIAGAFPNINQYVTVIKKGGGGGGGSGAPQAPTGDVMAGIAQNVNAGVGNVQSAVVNGLKAATDAATDYLEARSPSQLYARKVGTPIIDGIILGILRKRGDLVKESAYTLSLFQGPWLSSDAFLKMQEPITMALFQTKQLQDKLSALEDQSKTRKKVFSLTDRIDALTGKKTSRDPARDAKKLKELQTQLAEVQKKGKVLKPQDLIADMTKSAQNIEVFTRSLRELTKDKLPSKLLGQLRELGVEGLPIIRMLASMSEQNMDRFVAAWKRGEKATEDFNKENKTIEAKDLLKDMKAQIRDMRQYNKDLKTLENRGFTRAMIDNLRSMGTEGAAWIKILANAPKKELPALRAAYAEWLRLQKAMGFTTREAEIAAIKEHKTNMLAAIKDMYASSLEQMRGFFGAMNASMGSFLDAQANRVSAFQGTFPSIFQGLDEFMSARQQALEAAAQASDAAAQEFKRQQDELASQMKAARDELQGQMGQIFSGPWMTGSDVQTRMDWGVKLGIGDLKRDLKEQVEIFKRWRSNIDTLLARGVPKGLVDQLAALGPEAVGNLDILVSASAGDLQDYISIWQSGQSAIGDAVGKMSFDIAEAANTFSSSIGQLTPTIDDLTTVLKMNLDAWTNWAADIAKLVAMNLPDDLIQQLIDAGPAAAAAIHALATAAPAQIAEFVRVWNEGVGKMKSFSDMFKKKMSLADINAQLQEQIANFNKWRGTLTEIQKKLLATPGLTKRAALLIIRQLEELGPEALPFLEGILAGADTADFDVFVDKWREAEKAMEEAAKITTGDQIALWRQFGIDVGQAILEGAQAMEQPLLNWLTNIVNEAIKNQGKGAKGKKGVSDPKREQGGGVDTMGGTTTDFDLDLSVFTDMPKTIEPGLIAATAMVKKNLALMELQFVESNIRINKEMLSQMNKWYSMWHQHGLAAVMAFTTGMQQNEGILFDYLSSLVGRILSAWMAGQSKAQPFMTTPVPVAGQAPGGMLSPNVILNGGGKSGGNTYVDMQVNAMQDQSLSSVLAAAQFRLENRV